MKNMHTNTQKQSLHTKTYTQKYKKKQAYKKQTQKSCIIFAQ